MNERRPAPALGRDLPVWWEPSTPSDACARPSERTVLLLYGEALAALRRARRLGDPRVDLGRALSILTELAASLAEREDREAVINLASLYHYMIHRLMEAVECGNPVPIIEVERLLQTLWEGWVQVIQSDVGSGFPDSLEEHDGPASSPPSLLSAS